MSSNFFEEQVLSVRHWTDRLFSFATTRDPGFRFRTGEFTMIGLKVDGRPLLRAYSVVSPSWGETLEFFSIKVPNGPLTSRLQHIKVGDPITVGRKATGTLVLDNLLPGRNLYLLGTGTGLAPFLSVIRDPETYARFNKVVLVHGCRHVADLAYEELICEELPAHEFLGAEIAEKLVYYPTVTREPFRNEGRVSTLLESGKLAADVGLKPVDPAIDRVMICGSPAMMTDIKTLLVARGFEEGSGASPGHFVVEKAFAER
ncbi:ferredoxin--NADP reductase [Xanthobacter dioxanivorans]|uniref:ferredoxin--NADP(+) reductase n=1 Tax=Xanthobacter dioxanivorans TaxID=2528964 RepID=A0A974PMC6_9HYPH|nr:ferredoxin--NADP reductase [Xanthobacter dioxanivorans]QRG06257.1 ferredoxin--NADP reductase [Xanthobacter dioxanivorans]